MNCRHCARALEHVFLDLGFAPPSNAYLSAPDLDAPETHFPLKLFVCANCWLVQTHDYARADELFRPDYAYFSSVSQSWLEHAARYVDEVSRRFSLGSSSHVVEIASNDGYLLKGFVARGVPCLGIEPTASTAAAAEALGIPTLREFFGRTLGERLADAGKRADLIIGNNVYAHVPDINDFTAGLKALLKPTGVVTLEFPHLLRLIEEIQFDTVYHEHFSYLSLRTVMGIFASAGLRVWDVQKLGTHGGSLRVFGCHEASERVTSAAVTALLAEEGNHGLNRLETYKSFQGSVKRVKDNLLYYLIEHGRLGKSIAAYGAAAKGNTLLNYAGVGPDLLPYVCDAAPSKQGKYMPGSHIPIVPPVVLQERKPQVVLILPWNISAEVTRQHSYVYDWGGEFVVAVPELRSVERS